MPENLKRLSLNRRVDLIFAFYRDAANRKFDKRSDVENALADLRREIRRQIEHAVRDDRELREGVPLELTDAQLCPACDVPVPLHGTVQTGRWMAIVCAGINGSKVFISPDAAAAIVDALTERKENDGREQRGSGSEDG